MTIQTMIKRVLPHRLEKFLCRNFAFASKTRKRSNAWLLSNCRDIQGKVLSIGSGNDSDGAGNFYKNYFPDALRYTTSEVSEACESDLTLDVRSMPEIPDDSYDCIFCSGVLEHVDDYRSGLAELTRILKTGGILLLGLPFRQAIHMSPHDFWRFTEFGIKHLLKNSYEIVSFESIDKDSNKSSNFPAAYWVKARKRNRFQP